MPTIIKFTGIIERIEGDDAYGTLYYSDGKESEVTFNSRTIMENKIDIGQKFLCNMSEKEGVMFVWNFEKLPPSEPIIISKEKELNVVDLSELMKEYLFTLDNGKQFKRGLITDRSVAYFELKDFLRWIVDKQGVYASLGGVFHDKN